MMHPDVAKVIADDRARQLRNEAKLRRQAAKARARKRWRPSRRQSDTSLRRTKWSTTT